LVVVTGTNRTRARARVRRGHVSVGRGWTVPGGPGAELGGAAAMPPQTGVTGRMRAMNHPPRGVPGWADTAGGAAAMPPQTGVTGRVRAMSHPPRGTGTAGAAWLTVATIVPWT
jgi:hypothetical protein